MTLLETVAQRIQQQPGITSQELADQLDRDGGSIRQAVCKLRQRKQVTGAPRPDRRKNCLGWHWGAENVKVCNLDIVDDELAAKFARPEGQAPWWVEFEEVV